MSRAYLSSLRARYDAATGAIDEIQNRAAAENGGQGRDLTADELAAIEARSAEASALVPQIRAAADQENRNSEVDQLAGAILARSAAAGGEAPPAAAPAGGTPAGTEHDRSTVLTGNAQTQDRDPGHYRKDGDHSFFSDILRSKLYSDRDAAQRLEEHDRALSTGVAGAGLVAPVWLTSEFESIARQGRVVLGAIRNLPLTSPAPMTLPGQTAGTDAVIAEQATENTHPSETDAFATGVVTVTPKPTSGIQVISRQMADMSNPAADSLIYADMLSVYNRKCEDAVVAKMVTAAGTAVTTFATEAAFSTSQAASDAIIDAAFSVWDARKAPATIVAMRIRRWQKFNKMRDSSGRKLYPTSDAGPMNVDGIGSVQASGNIDGLPVLVSEGLGTTAYPESILVARASDIIFWEGEMRRFSFEEVAGPESVKLGVWAYTASVVRQAANSVRRVVITAA
jgi:HK97 family phage major capsid protein